MATFYITPNAGAPDNGEYVAGTFYRLKTALGVNASICVGTSQNEVGWGCCGTPFTPPVFTLGSPPADPIQVPIGTGIGEISLSGTLPITLTGVAPDVNGCWALYMRIDANAATYLNDTNNYTNGILDPALTAFGCNVTGLTCNANNQANVNDDIFVIPTIGCSISTVLVIG